ncbi:uncharacterized protein LY89DRAFT_724042 [Mollisia scopiformis]|uniref:DUF7704 domain-containing protein n=1 Tax=Mollisia scopiformis TaxID=149040 RepID=A0A132BC74_MOLSC|nr:uncharacterized protein LY89DRAFT_724042 [Mollisia scopiformis]KUJ09609.1 hypothetical protein LY89DRAFT_724042 [Mollisia scopiformis]
MASIMPPIPRFFFLYIEPSLCFFGGAFQPVLNPHSITTLLPAPLAGRHTTDPNPTPLETMLALQSATLMFMIAMVTVIVMVFAKDRAVVRGYVVASAVTDLPHWASFAYVLGWEGLRQWRTWEAPLWMQLLVPVFTLMFKLGYLSGAFGEDRVPEKKGRKEL